MAQTALFIAGSAAGNLILNRLVSKGALKAVLVAFGGLSFARFWGEFSHHPSIMSLLFFPRGLDEMGFEASGELRESAADRQFVSSGNTDIHAT
jgi:hypothetical protein